MMTQNQNRVNITDRKELNSYFNNKFSNEILAELSSYLRTPNPNQPLMRDIESYVMTSRFLKPFTFEQQITRKENLDWGSKTIQERGEYIQSMLKFYFNNSKGEYGQKYQDREDEIDFLVQTKQLTYEEEWDERNYIKTLYFMTLFKNVCENVFEEEERTAIKQHFYRYIDMYFQDVMDSLRREGRSRNRYEV
jgi:hypothetical protein